MITPDLGGVVDKTTTVGAIAVFCVTVAAGLPFALDLGARISAPTVVYTPSPYDSPHYRRPVAPPRQPVAPPQPRHNPDGGWWTPDRTRAPWRPTRAPQPSPTVTPPGPSAVPSATPTAGPAATPTVGVEPTAPHTTAPTHRP